MSRSWLPYQVVSEVDRKSDPMNLGRSSPLVGAWITTLLLLNIVSAGGGALAWLALLGSQTAAATLAILVIRRVQTNQLTLATRADAHSIAAQFA